MIAYASFPLQFRSILLLFIFNQFFIALLNIFVTLFDKIGGSLTISILWSNLIDITDVMVYTNVQYHTSYIRLNYTNI